MKLTELTEGATRLLVPVGNDGPGPGAKQSDAPFYNPGMSINRDLSVLLVACEAEARNREIDVADVLAGAGARSLRLANEVELPLVVHANDGDPNAIAAMEEARAMNEIPTNRMPIRHGSAASFLAERRFDIVDVDPFGTPQSFLDAAVRATRHGGLVCLTATDTGALCGTYPKACRRRYGAEPLHSPAWRAEVGLRILQGAVVRAAGRLDRSAAPIFSIASGHWMRVVMRLTDDKSAADAASKQIGFVAEHEATGQAIHVESGAGPIWWGKLHDGEVLRSMLDMAKKGLTISPKSIKLLEKMVLEADAAPFWLHLPHLHRRLGGQNIPKQARFIQVLEENGYSVGPSHMDPEGVRCDANAVILQQLWQSLTAKA